MPLYKIGSDCLQLVPERGFAEENLREKQDLQPLLRDQIDVIESGLLVIAEEFGAWDRSQRRIDLLAIDRQARLVVIELKIEPGGGHMELQAIRYAAMVAEMTFSQAVDALSDHLAKHGQDQDAEGALLEHLSWDAPQEERFGESVRIILVSPAFSDEIVTATLWLNKQGVELKCVQVTPHGYDGNTLLDIRQLIPLPEAEDLQVRVRDKQHAQKRSRQANAEWSGLWYVNIGMDESGRRDWDACRELGFLSAGGGAKYSDALRHLSEGDVVAAYQKGKGYVGVGRITQGRTRIDRFLVDGDQPLSTVRSELFPAEQEDADREYVVGVQWLDAVPLSEAKAFNGIFANPNIVCKLREPATIAFLKAEFKSWADSPEPTSID